jgi:H+/Cl- antiporter ClcA
MSTAIAPRLRRLTRMPLVSPRQWLRRVVFWFGALVVAVVAVLFARAGDKAGELFDMLFAISPWLPVALAPVGLVVAVLLTRTVFPGAQGSGIPQTIAAIHLDDAAAVNALLSLKVAVGKVVLTLLGLACGASIGREGPTVQIGAAIMHGFGRLLDLPRRDVARALIVAGGAAGVAAAFNTPIAGIVFAIEELSRSFESRTSGLVFTAVIVAGATTVVMAGNYVYFGTTYATLAIGIGWVAVPACGIAGGLAGGVFSLTLVTAGRGFGGGLGRFVMRHPLVFAAICGLVIAVCGLLTGGQTYGSGYSQARGLVEGAHGLAGSYAALKLVATAASYLSGIPGGIFAPSLSVGAGLGAWLAPLLPFAPSSAVILLGMVGYFSGVVQAPLTATVIVMEMADNQGMTVPLMATSMLAFAVSRIVCRHPLYHTLADRFLVASHKS